MLPRKPGLLWRLSMGMKPQDRSQGQFGALPSGPVSQEGTFGNLWLTHFQQRLAQRLRAWKAPGQPSTGPRIPGKVFSGCQRDPAMWQPWPRICFTFVHSASPCHKPLSFYLSTKILPPPMQSLWHCGLWSQTPNSATYQLCDPGTT